MLGGRAGEVVSRQETPSQCGRVGSPGCQNTIMNGIFVRNLILCSVGIEGSKYLFGYKIKGYVEKICQK